MKYYAFFAIMIVKFEIENGESDEGEDRFWVFVLCPRHSNSKKRKRTKDRRLVKGFNGLLLIRLLPGLQVCVGGSV